MGYWLGKRLVLERLPLMTDGYTGYNDVVRNEKLVHLCCMAYVRRKFVEFRAWIDKSRLSVLPKSKLGKALAYSEKYWEKITRYVENGDWPIDNNTAENAIRLFVIGRKAWLFSNTVRGANASAALYSLIETAKLNDHEPYDYLTWLFTTLPSHGEDVEAIMPWSADRETVKAI